MSNLIQRCYIFLKVENLLVVNESQTKGFFVLICFLLPGRDSWLRTHFENHFVPRA